MRLDDREAPLVLTVSSVEEEEEEEEEEGLGIL